MSATETPPDQAPPISALYFDVATFEQFRTETPYPFSRFYQIGQSFTSEHIGWTVVSAWVERGIYYVLCSKLMPAYLVSSLCNSIKPAKPAPDTITAKHVTEWILRHDWEGSPSAARVAIDDARSLHLT